MAPLCSRGHGLWGAVVPLRAAHDSSRVDETYIKITRQWYDLYRAVASTGATLDFMLRPARDADAAQRFCRKALGAGHTATPRVITVDQNPAYPPAFEPLQPERLRPETCLLRRGKSFNTVIEQGHRLVKRCVNPELGCGAFATAQRPLQGYEAMHRLHKGQLEGIAKGDILAQNQVINQLFGVAA
jgi:transposase, IS6 family